MENKHNGKLSKLWYLLPIVPGLLVGPLGAIGGLVMYAKVRKRDPMMAKLGIVAGIIAGVIPFALLAVMTSSAPV